MLEARDLRKSYGGVIAMDSVTLSIRPGEVVGMVGPNGSGKSTLLDVLCGRIKPDRGTVLINGRTLAERSRNGQHHPFPVFRTHQVPRLFPAHTVDENLALGGWNIPEDAKAYLLDLLQGGGV
jgi:ABC-type branched-subunit amino acid transport system ATPase component